MTRIAHLLPCLLLAAALPAPAAEAPARRDTTVVQDLVVVGDHAPDAAPATVVFQPDALAAVTPWNAGDLEALIPASTITVNSRGESVLMIRGASERHVGVTLDGIPLAVPWDERADLSLIPLDGVATLRAERGVSTLLSPPNAVAGTVTLETDGRGGPDTRLELRAGTGQDRALRAVHRAGLGAWDVTASVSRRTRDSAPLPDGADLPYHQIDPDRRTNTDLAQTSALLRAVRPLARGGRLALLLTGADAERGVAPEGHVDQDARLWRLPLVRRGLLGASLHTPLDHVWDLDAGAALDLAAQDIRAYPDDTYTDTPLTAGDPLEQGRDRTAHLHGKLRRFLGARSSVAVGGRLRWTRHTVTEEVDGPELAYAQRLASVSLEADMAGHGPWRARLGAGIDAAATPETGVFPRQDARVEPALLARVERSAGRRGQVYAAVSRRSRFPGLRELYSGALGRFAPNPDLTAERQDLAEAGWQGRAAGWDLTVTGFTARLADGIERVRLDDGRFQRVNRSTIRTRGLELAGSRRLGPLEVAVHHAVLDAEVDPGDGGAVRPAEDRADYQGALLVEWRQGAWAAGVTARWIGARWSADSTDEVDGLRELGAQGWGDLWVSREIGVGADETLEVRVAMRNVTDEGVWEQVGLVGEGRALVIGGKVEWW